MEKIINIAKDFSPTPAGRYRDYGDFSGEAFREDILLPSLLDNNISSIIINFNGLKGVGSSFWDEVFGEIIRNNMSKSDFYNKVNFVCDDDITLIPTIKKIIEEN